MLTFKAIFLIPVARAPALVWQIKNSRRGKLLIRRSKNWPLVNHYHFHILDKQWGHITIRMSGHPPFGAQIVLNGHEWLERQARKEAICYVKEGNCFVGGSDLSALNRLAEGLGDSWGLARLAQVCDRWIYSACLCFGLTPWNSSGRSFITPIVPSNWSTLFSLLTGALLDFAW
jgi:hypothetical protein